MLEVVARSADLLATAFVFGATAWFFFVQSPVLLKRLGREGFVPVQMRLTVVLFQALTVALVAAVAAAIAHAGAIAPVTITAAVALLAGVINGALVVPRALRAGGQSRREIAGRDAESSTAGFASEGAGSKTRTLHRLVVLFVVVMLGGAVPHGLLLLRGSAPTPPPTPAGSAPSAACASAENRQFDFWIGDWDLVVATRQAPDSDVWVTARGRQHVEAILGGCAISEAFTADGPGTPWAGRSHSMWQAKPGTWRQTWVDDQGSYLAFTGKLEGGVMTLYGEPFEQAGKTIQMRMVFEDVTRDALRWKWQRTDDAWQTSRVMMKIDYVRRR